jgi:hypothetical protein
LIAGIYTTLGAVAVVLWNPKRQRDRSCPPPTWTTDELAKRTSIERFFGRVHLSSYFRYAALCPPAGLARALPS